MRNHPSREFIDELKSLINRHSLDAATNTPDFILTAYLVDQIVSYGTTLERTRGWHSWPTLAESLADRLKKGATPDV